MLLVVVLWIHIEPAQKLSRTLILAGTLLYAVALAFQLIRQVYMNVNRHLEIGRVEIVDRDWGLDVIGVRLSHRWTVQPGTYVLLTVLSWRHASFLQRHPLMVAWIESSDGESTIYFVVQPQKGWTGCLSTSLVDRKVWLDGLYGKPYDAGSRDLSDHDTVLLVAEESGIFAHLLILRHLVKSVNCGAMKTRRIILYWKARGFHDRIRFWLTEVVVETDGYLTVMTICAFCSL